LLILFYKFRVQKISESKQQSDEEDDDDEDEDDLGDDSNPSRFHHKGKTRRVGVSSESSDPSKIKAQMSKVTCIEKAPDIATRLLNAVSKSTMLRTLDHAQKEVIVKAFTGPIDKVAGDKIIVQGDIGDAFYLLEDGSVDVFVRKGKGADIKVHTYSAGDSFGELALMYNAPRAATCIATGNCRLWALDRISFKVIVVAASMHKREMYQSFLKKVPILESLTEMEIMTLADSLAEEQYGNNTVVCTQGEPGDYFYIIKEGEAVCTQVDAQGNQKEVGYLKSGNYFGEIALLTKKARQATVRAIGTLIVLAIDRATFIRVMGPLDDLMKRNMEQYNKYQAANI
jgi:cAMP-dependent protein kinase regulator